MPFEATSLYNKAFVRKESDNFRLERTRLTSALASFRNNADLLTKGISASFPGLTVHDVSHLDALWELADLIAGEGYELTPLEAFVFGGSVLLHDAALTFEAYSGGQEGVRNTTEWSDAFARITEEYSFTDENEIFALADFAAVRKLHAERSSDLPLLPFKREGEPDLFLLDDSGLRDHLGPIIGTIASSHHWDVDQLTSLPLRINSPGDFPAEWHISPLKVAALLRCADAAHLDGRRAPDFLRALLKRNRTSASHWTAQNWIGRPTLYPYDRGNSTLLYTSTRSFPPDEQRAWWVAYDAITLVDRELRAVHDLLSSPTVGSDVVEPFAVRSVYGAGSARKLRDHLRTSGWTPVDAELHVSNVQGLVEKLGGSQLYGTNVDHLQVALRELIQNSRDAIVARGWLDKDYDARLVIRVDASPDGGVVLSVEDDGLGMSERVLTGPFLDFGTSFWATDMVEAEFPGLRSSGVKPVGRFGIGFYACFTCADAVTVASRRFDAARKEVKELVFEDGIFLRPLLREDPHVQDIGRNSTVVKLRLRDDLNSGGGAAHRPEANSFVIRPSNIGGTDLAIGFCDYVASITAGLDVAVSVSILGEEPDRCHTPITAASSEEELMAWLKAISFAEYDSGAISEEMVRDTAKRIRPVVVDGQVRGMAAIVASVELVQGHNMMGVPTIGGLATDLHARYNVPYCGYLNSKPLSVRRDAIEPFRADQLLAWAEEQADLLLSYRSESDRMSRLVAAYSLSSLGLSIERLIYVPVATGDHGSVTGLQLLSLPELAEELKRGGQFVAYVEKFLDVMAYPLSGQPFLTDRVIYAPFGSGEFVRMSVDTDSHRPTVPHSLVGSIDDYLRRQELQPKWHRGPSDIAGRFGLVDRLVVSL